MLRGISPLISPRLLETLPYGSSRRNRFRRCPFSGESKNKNIIRADGLGIIDLLDAILPLFVLDHAVKNPVVMMEPVKEDQASGELMKGYRKYMKIILPPFIAIIQKALPIEKMDKFDFYQRTEKAFTVVMTGDTRIYANLILIKGVTTW